MHPRRNVNRVIEGSDKPTTIDVEWWNDLQPNDIIVLGTYAIMRPLEQGFLGDAWERDEMRHAIKLACDAHARDNYAITTIRMGEALAPTAKAEDTMAFAMAAPILAVAAAEVNDSDEPTLESETAPLSDAPLAFASEPTLESETAPLSDEPSLESETAPLSVTLDSDDMVETEAEASSDEAEMDNETIEEVTADLDETEAEFVEVVAEPVAEIVATPVVVAPIIGNYKYEDEEEETTGGIAWIPTVPKVEEIIAPVATPVVAVVTPIITTPIIPNVMDNINQTSTNIGNTVKGTTTNIVDFTPVSDKTKAKVAETASTAQTGFGNWGWLIAAAMLFVGLAVWFGQSMFGGVDKELSAQVERGMETKLAGAMTPKDSLEVYAEYKTMVSDKYKGKISADLIAKIEKGTIDNNATMSPQADGVTASDMNGSTTPALADAAATDAKTAAAAAEAAAKEIATEAAVKTKTAVAGVMPSVPVTESGALTKAKPAIAKAKTTDQKAQPSARMGRPAAGAKVVGGVNTVKADPLKAFDKVWAESEGFRVVSKGGKWGWINADGSSLIAPIYEECGSFHNGMAAVKKGGKWGFTNAAGKLVVDYKYKSITAFGAKCPGLAQVNDGAKMTYIDASGKEAAACK
jgi:hypothetical protein